MLKLKYIITGTGRCGTVFLARVLTSLGVPCGHETVFDYHGYGVAMDRIERRKSLRLSNASMIKFEGTHCSVVPEWLTNINSIVADSSYLAAPFVNKMDVDVIHLVRDPMKVVNSFCNYINYFNHSVPSNPYEEFIYRFIPDMYNPMSQYERACLYYLRWNQMIEQNVVGKRFIFHRIEDDLKQILDFIGVGVKDDIFKDKKVNSFEKITKTFTLKDLKYSTLKRDFIDMGRRYGYRMALENLII